ncbi:MAG: hypothetical protein U0N74_04140 [Peptococcaceae bacterium]
MPDRKTHFSEAENNKYNVSNVLNVMNDGSSYRPHKAETVESQEDAQAVEINLEEGAPFIDGIDPQATIGEYMKRHEEEEALEEAAHLQINEERDPDIEETEVAIQETETQDSSEDDVYVYQEQDSNVKSQVIREQAQKARDPFFDDLRSVDSEPAIQRMKEREMMAEENDESDVSLKEEKEGPSPARRIRKPRFVKTAPVEETEVVHQESHEAPENEETPVNDNVEEPEKEETFKDTETDDAYEDDYYIEETEEAQEEPVDELTQVRAAEHNSICQDLHDLQKHLEEANSPMFHKNEVLVPREKTLRLIRSLTVLCDVDPSYIDGASEDLLIDRLACDPGNGEYEPLKRARCRAQTIIQNASKQAETIITDAKVLATQLLAETEAEIKEKYDDADLQIAVRMDTAKEESSKKLNEARSELTASRQHSVEILSKYLEKAEIDYQGYWERAENTVMASLEQSESILTKAADIYRKELEVIRQDRDELSEILDHLKRYRPLS